MSFRALASSFRMGDTTVGRIVKETVEILWEELHPLHMPLPTVVDDPPFFSFYTLFD